MVLSADRIGLRLSGRALPVFSDVNLSLDGGQTCLVEGRAGSGKTLFGIALCGFLPLWVGGWSLEGSIELFGEKLIQGENSANVGIILENPYSQLSGMKKTVRSELAFPLESVGVPRGEMMSRVVFEAERLGIYHLLDRDVRTLSGGELQRVLVAAALIARPRFLFLDRPLTEIDTGMRPAIMELVRTCVIESDGAAVIAEDPWLLPGMTFDKTVCLGGDMYDASASSDLTVQGGGSGEPVLEIDGLSFAYGDGFHVINGLSLTVRAGETVLVTGPNGGGKTTLARLIAGLLVPNDGLISIGGCPAEDLSERERFSQMGYALQNPALHFSRGTVREELDAIPVRNRRTETLIDILGLDALMDVHPFELTSAEKKLLGMALSCGGNRRVLVLDEPSQYQDSAGFARFMEAVSFLTGEGAGVIIITHDPRCIEAFPDAGILVKGAGVD